MRLTQGLKAKIKATLAKQPNGPLQPTELMYRGKGYRLVACPGNAHSADVGGMQDHCALCMPLWGVCVEFLGYVGHDGVRCYPDSHAAPDAPHVCVRCSGRLGAQNPGDTCDSCKESK